MLSIKFDDLINGRLDRLAEFMQTDFTVNNIAPANADKPIRSSGRYPAFADWPKANQQTMLRICGPLMERLGYL